MPAFEHIQQCEIPGGKEVIKLIFRINLSKWGRYQRLALEFFIPRFKALLKHCKCEEESCLKSAHGWNCQTCHRSWCKSRQEYCISLEEGIQILDDEFGSGSASLSSSAEDSEESDNDYSSSEHKNKYTNEDDL